MSWLLSIPGALLTIAVLVTVHEFGHFAAAKFFGVHVRVFSIGFGTRLFGYTWRGTDYRVSAIPFGGYVRWAGGDPFSEGGGDVEEDEPTPTSGLFTSKPPWQRLIINFAGPAINILLPVVLFTGLLMAGDPQPEARIGGVVRGSAAEAAGIVPGDHIVDVGGVSVRTDIDVRDELAEARGNEVRVTVRGAAGERAVALPFPAGGDRSATALGLDFYAPPRFVGVDDPASPAGKAGVITGDEVRAVNGVPVHDFIALAAALADAPGPVTLDVYREADAPPLTVTVEPRSVEGVVGATDADSETWRRWGLAPGSVFAGQVGPDSAAEAAGLRVGDRLLQVDDRPVRGWDDVVNAVSASATGDGETMTARPVEVTVRRDGALVVLTGTPRTLRDTAGGVYYWRVLFGVGPSAADVPGERVTRPYPFTEAVSRASSFTFQLGAYMLELIGKMFTREAAPSELIGGPVAVLGALKAAAEAGVFELFRQTGMISLSLGIINLLPVPIFDGGQMVMNFAEWVRGRPLPYLIRERIQQVGVIFVIVLMFAVLVNDTWRWISKPSAR